MIEDLKRIICVVQEGSVTRAAQKMYMTQPALSQAIRRVEKIVGVRVFRAQGKKLFLTKNGKELLLVMERIVTLWDSMIEKGSELKKSNYVIGMYDNAALLLSYLCKKYYEANMIGFEVIIDNSEKLFSQLRYGILDVCICVCDSEWTIPQNSELVVSYEEELIPVSGKKWSTCSDKIQYILYNRDSITRKYIDKTFILHAIKPSVIAESTSPSFIKELALVGSGVALLPKNFVKNELEKGDLYRIELPLDFRRTVGVYKNNSNDSLMLDSIIANIKTCLL